MTQSEPAHGVFGDLPGTERITVRFRGEGSGVAGLTWGQVGLWDAMRRQRSWFPIGAVNPVPAGTTVADLAGELRFMMERYQTLRTRLRLEPDGTKQVLFAAGEIPLEIFDAPELADPARLAAEIMRRYSAAPYDFVEEWPVRMAAIRHRGAVGLKVVVLCHLTTDGLGASIIARELAERELGSAPAPPPVPNMEPLEQARWQGSPAGKRQNEAGLRYCARVLRRVSARRFPEPVDRPRPRYWYASFGSRALYLAVQAIAPRTQADTATMLLALYAIGHVRVTGIDPTMTMVLVSNRYRRGLAGTVSPVTQAVPCAIDVAGATVDEVVAQTRGRALGAYKHGYHDPRQFDQMVAQVSRERGEAIDTACYFNDRGTRFRDLPPGPPPSAAQVRAARSQTRFEWKLKQDDEPYERFFLHIEDDPEQVAISVVMDTHQVSPADAEGCLRGMEEVAVAAVADPWYRPISARRT